MTSQTDELKPCPFCGDKASFRKWDNGYVTGLKIECNFCDCKQSFTSAFSKSQAAKVWNTRVDQPCPHVFTSKGGTSHCTLAASEIDRHLAEIDRLRVDREAEMEGLWRIIEGHLAEIDRLKRQVKVLQQGIRNGLDACLGLYQFVLRNALAAADKIAKE